MNQTNVSIRHTARYLHNRMLGSHNHPRISSLTQMLHNTHLQPPSPQLKAHSLELGGGSPDVLQETVLLGKTVDGVVRLALRADKSGESISNGLAGVAAVLIDLADGDLDGSVVLGLNFMLAMLSLVC
jgi:hypothetical protein